MTTPSSSSTLRSRRRALSIRMVLTSTLIVVMVSGSLVLTTAAAVAPVTALGANAAAERQDLEMKRLLVERRKAANRPSRDASRIAIDRDDRRPRQPRPPAWLRRCTDGGVDAAQSHPNGQLPSTELCQLPSAGHLLHADAAKAWWRLNRAFKRRFDTGLCATDSYRSYEAQAAVYGQKPGLAAVPGTSNHGWGVAMDLCGGVESYTSPQHAWLAMNSAKYGWVNPSWAQARGSRPEPWHWEYVGK